MRSYQIPIFKESHRKRRRCSLQIWMAISDVLEVRRLQCCCWERSPITHLEFSRLILTLWGAISRRWPKSLRMIQPKTLAVSIPDKLKYCPFSNLISSPRPKRLYSQSRKRSKWVRDGILLEKPWGRPSLCSWANSPWCLEMVGKDDQVPQLHRLYARGIWSW